MLFSTGSNEIQQLRWKSSLGRILGAVSLKPWSSKCRSIRSSHGAIQPPPDSKGDADFRMALADTSPDHTHAGQHHLHRVRYDVLRAAALEAIDADRRHAARRALVEADREIEILGGRPKWLVIRVVDHLVVVRVGSQKAAAESQFPAGKAHLGDCQVDRLHRQHRDTE